MNLWTWALDMLFPPKCPFCGCVLDEPTAPVCPKCQPALPWLEGKEALRKVDFTDGCYSPLEYKETVRECVHRYKFTPVRAYGAPLGRLMAQCVQDHPEIAPDVIVWAPLSRKSLRGRGFDQAEELARETGRELRLDVEPILMKQRDTKQQSTLTEKGERRANVLGAYSLRPNSSVEGRRVLLVDDVVTSGATLSACAKVLYAAGAAKIWCVTLAQAGK